MSADPHIFGKKKPKSGKNKVLKGNVFRRFRETKKTKKTGALFFHEDTGGNPVIDQFQSEYSRQLLFSFPAMPAISMPAIPMAEQPIPEIPKMPEIPGMSDLPPPLPAAAEPLSYSSSGSFPLAPSEPSAVSLLLPEEQQLSELPLPELQNFVEADSFSQGTLSQMSELAVSTESQLNIDKPITFSPAVEGLSIIIPTFKQDTFKETISHLLDPKAPHQDLPFGVQTPNGTKMDSKRSFGVEGIQMDGTMVKGRVFLLSPMDISEEAGQAGLDERPILKSTRRQAIRRKKGNSSEPKAGKKKKNLKVASQEELLSYVKMDEHGNPYKGGEKLIVKQQKNTKRKFSGDESRKGPSKRKKRKKSQHTVMQGSADDTLRAYLQDYMEKFEKNEKGYDPEIYKNLEIFLKKYAMEWLHCYAHCLCPKDKDPQERGNLACAPAWINTSMMVLELIALHLTKHYRGYQIDVNSLFQLLPKSEIIKTVDFSLGITRKGFEGETETQRPSSDYGPMENAKVASDTVDEEGDTVMAHSPKHAGPGIHDMQGIKSLRFFSKWDASALPSRSNWTSSSDLQHLTTMIDGIINQNVPRERTSLSLKV